LEAITKCASHDPLRKKCHAKKQNFSSNLPSARDIPIKMLASVIIKFYPRT